MKDFKHLSLMSGMHYRIDGALCLQTEESPKKNPSLLQPAGKLLFT